MSSIRLLNMFEGRKENVLFNNTCNTFDLLLYDVEHMVKDHLDSVPCGPILQTKTLEVSVRVILQCIHIAKISVGLISQ